MLVLLCCLACLALRTPKMADVYCARASDADSSHDSSDSSYEASSASPCKFGFAVLGDFFCFLADLGVSAFRVASDVFLFADWGVTAVRVECNSPVDRVIVVDRAGAFRDVFCFSTGVKRDVAAVDVAHAMVAFSAA